MQVIRCPQCGKSLPWIAHYCANCGHALTSCDDGYDATIKFRKPARKELQASYKIPAFYAIKDGQLQQVAAAADIEPRSLGNGHSPRVSVQTLDNDNDLIAQQRIDEWLSDNEDEDELERRATWQKIVTHKTPTLTFVAPRVFAVVDTGVPRPASSLSPNTPTASAHVPPLLPVTPLINLEPPRNKRRMPSFPRLSSWITVLVLLALLLGGAFGIYVSLGKYNTPPKSSPNVMSLQVSPSIHRIWRDHYPARIAFQPERAGRPVS